jgi:hypothetical protein
MAEPVAIPALLKNMGSQQGSSQWASVRSRAAALDGMGSHAVRGPSTTTTGLGLNLPLVAFAVAGADVRGDPLREG